MTINSDSNRYDLDTKNISPDEWWYLELKKNQDAIIEAAKKLQEEINGGVVNSSITAQVPEQKTAPSTTSYKTFARMSNYTRI